MSGADTEAQALRTGETADRDSAPMAKNAAAGAATPHVLVIPNSMVTHRVPLLRLASRLSASAEDIIFSFVSYEEDIPNLAAEVSAALSSTKQDHESIEEQLFRQGFRFVAVRRRPDKPPFSLDDYQRELEPFVAKWAQDIENGVAGGPTCVFSDMFVPWTQDLADKLRIPRYAFFAAGVIFVKYMLEFLCLEESGMHNIGENGELRQFEGVLTLPELPPLRYLDLPRLTRTNTKAAFVCCKSYWKSAGLVINSFEGLDEQLIRTWSKSGASLPAYTKVPKTYLLGPFFLKDSAKTLPAKAGSADSFGALHRWLDSQARASVLYVAFGTQVRLSAEQMHELALGLEGSEQHFVWVVPKPDSEKESIYDALPGGFQERVGDRAYIVAGFAPQLEILGHPSVGAFLTHTGWNSSLEAIVYGVPLITWPQGAEQQLNSRYLSNQVNVAYEMQTGPSNVAGRDQIVEAIRHVLVGLEGKSLRTRAEELQQRASVAVSERGSQSKNYQNLLNDIRNVV